MTPRESVEDTRKGAAVVPERRRFKSRAHGHKGPVSPSAACPAAFDSAGPRSHPELPAHNTST